MRKNGIVLFVFFIVSSCTYEDNGFRALSKKEAMESWAWKIFIFTDEGEIPSDKMHDNKFDDISLENSIFASGFYGMDLNENFYSKKNELALESTAKSNLRKGKIKK